MLSFYLFSRAQYISAQVSLPRTVLVSWDIKRVGFNVFTFSFFTQGPYCGHIPMLNGTCDISIIWLWTGFDFYEMRWQFPRLYIIVYVTFKFYHSFSNCLKCHTRIITYTYNNRRNICAYFLMMDYNCDICFAIPCLVGDNRTYSEWIRSI